MGEFYVVRLAILLFAAGCALVQTRADLPGLGWALGWAPLLAALALWSAQGESPASGQAALARWLPRALWLAMAGLCGFGYAVWRAELRLAESLDARWQGRDVVLEGRVIGLPERTPAGGLRWVFEAERSLTPGAALGHELPRRVRLGWFSYDAATPPEIAGGDCLRLAARLYRPHGNLNPGGFDVEGWLFERGIRATGALRDLPQAATCAPSPRAALDRLRENLRQRLHDRLGDAPYAGVVIALAVGDQDAISSAQWTQFRQTGTTHLFSVSGLHITLFAALVAWAVRALWRRWPALNLRLPARRAAILLGLAAATTYTAISGFGIPAQRTLFMLAAAAAMLWLDRASSASRVLAAALLAVMLLDPWAALAPGFWLSFTAVAALLWAGLRARARQEAAWRGWLRTQWAVTLALTPLLLALFHEVSLVSPLANTVAIPAISLLAVPLALLALALPLTADAAHGVAAGVMFVLDGLAAWPQPVFHAAHPTPLAMLLALCGAVLLLAPRGFPGRALGWILLLPLFFPRLPAPAPGQVWLDALDVGQGQAMLLRTARHTLLADSGPRHASGEDAGARVIAPALWAMGLNRLDTLLVSHDDIDHSGGGASLVASHRPAALLSSLAGMPAESLSETGHALLLAAARAGARVTPCAAGQAWTWDGVRFSVLHPPAHQYRMPGYTDNERSCVLRVEAGRHALLITGDIERLSETNLFERGMPLKADVLVVAHHGSKSSSNAAFLDAVRPALAVIPVGRRNRYGHPHPAVLARLRERGIGILRTDHDGAIHLELGGANIPEPIRWREAARRYWHETGHIAELNTRHDTPPRALGNHNWTRSPSG